MDLRIRPLQEEDFEKVIELGGRVHGKNYLTPESLAEIRQKSLSNGKCCSYVLLDGPRPNGKLVGFRLTYAPGKWKPDEWCSVDAWGVDPEKVCYFKSNTLDPAYRGQGLGPHLLDVSIQTVKSQGAEAGITHIWMSSPGKTAFKYFRREGGELLWIWPRRWEDDWEKDGYICAYCCRFGRIQPCNCLAAEMILHFGEQEDE